MPATVWICLSNPPEVMPDDDLRPHEEGAGCWCRPSLDDGVITHHSLDQRERYETGELRKH